jgi:hypothetical protein
MPHSTSPLSHGCSSPTSRGTLSSQHVRSSSTVYPPASSHSTLLTTHSRACQQTLCAGVQVKAQANLLPQTPIPTPTPIPTHRPVTQM